MGSVYLPPKERRVNIRICGGPFRQPGSFSRLTLTKARRGIFTGLGVAVGQGSDGFQISPSSHCSFSIMKN